MTCVGNRPITGVRKKLVFINETRRDFSFFFLDITSSDISSETESPLLYLYWYSFFASVGIEESLSVLLSPFHGMHVYIVYCAEYDEV